MTMFECRHCHHLFKEQDSAGARCPACRLPMYERDRQRAPVVDLGPCAVHPDNSAAAKCQRCGKMMCSLCRTRWDQEIICAACLDDGLEKGELSPKLIQAQQRQAASSAIMALLGWIVLLLALWPLSALWRSQPGPSAATFAVVLFYGSLLFGIFGLGQGAACVRARGRRLSLASFGLTLAGLHLGVCVGVLVMNVWHQ